MFQGETVLRNTVRLLSGGITFRTASGRTVYVSRATAAAILAG